MFTYSKPPLTENSFCTYLKQQEILCKNEMINEDSDQEVCSFVGQCCEIQHIDLLQQQRQAGIVYITNNTLDVNIVLTYAVA